MKRSPYGITGDLLATVHGVGAAMVVILTIWALGSGPGTGLGALLFLMWPVPSVMALYGIGGERVRGQVRILNLLMAVLMVVVMLLAVPALDPRSGGAAVGPLFVLVFSSMMLLALVTAWRLRAPVPSL